jgi:hypothetical protein
VIFVFTVTGVRNEKCLETTVLDHKRFCFSHQINSVICGYSNVMKKSPP